MRLVVGADHAGYHLKGTVVAALHSWGHTVEDVGAHSPEPVDFPDVAWAVCAAVRADRVERGVLVCGTGVGACIAANKAPGIRAALGHDAHSAHQCVEHDDTNVLCLGAQIVGEWLALDLLRTYLAAEFRDEEPFRRRLAKVVELEQRAAALMDAEREQPAGPSDDLPSNQTPAPRPARSERSPVRGGYPGSRSGGLHGRATVKVLPRPGVDSAQSRPPCAATIIRARYSSNPRPPAPGRRP